MKTLALFMIAGTLLAQDAPKAEVSRAHLIDLNNAQFALTQAKAAVESATAALADAIKAAQADCPAGVDTKTYSCHETTVSKTPTDHKPIGLNPKEPK